VFWLLAGTGFLKMISIRKQIECVDREILMRKTAYPKWVKAGKMKQEAADYEIKAMEAVRNSLLLMPKDVALVKL